MWDLWGYQECENDGESVQRESCEHLRSAMLVDDEDGLGEFVECDSDSRTSRRKVMEEFVQRKLECDRSLQFDLRTFLEWKFSKFQEVPSSILLFILIKNEWVL